LLHFLAVVVLDYVRIFDNQQEVTVFGSHFVQEISPNAIGQALAVCMCAGAV
jgi:hypothetical protein